MAVEMIFKRFSKKNQIFFDYALMEHGTSALVDGFLRRLKEKGGNGGNRTTGNEPPRNSDSKIGEELVHWDVFGFEREYRWSPLLGFDELTAGRFNPAIATF